MDTYFVYTLNDHQNVPFYIGQTNNLAKRLKRHLYEAQKGNTLYIYNKIRQILRGGGKVNITAVVSGLSPLEADEKEIELIAEYRLKGSICNILAGGQTRMTPELQKQAAEKRRGQRRSNFGSIGF